MIRNVNPRKSLTYRRRLGDALSAAAGLSSIASAGIGAGVSLATSAVGMWMNSIQLSHNADTATTLIVNGLASQLQNLLNAYMADPPSCASQRAALDAYDQAWLWLQSPQACGNPNYGSAGNRCISDRAPGGPYPWQTYYRDPIANDPRLAGQGCDTGQEVLLPSLTTGTYQDTGITSTGGSSTGAPATSAPIASPSSVAVPAINAAGIPAIYLVGAALVGVYLLTR